MKPKHPHVITLTLGELDTNCYIAYCPETLEAVVIDPADDGDMISEEILRLQLKPTAILLTHGHFDHVLGLLPLRLNFDDIPIFLHPKDLFLIAEAQKSAEYWLKHPVDPVPKPTHTLSENTAFSFGHCELTTLPLPGHTPGSVAFVSKISENDVRIFVGDTLFKNGVGRTDFKYSSALHLEKSLATLMKYPKNTILYPGHGEKTTVATEYTNLGYTK